MLIFSAPASDANFARPETESHTNIIPAINNNLQLAKSILSTLLQRNDFNTNQPVL